MKRGQRIEKERFVWTGLIWSGLVWSGLVWSDLVWSGLVWSGLVTCQVYEVLWKASGKQLHDIGAVGAIDEELGTAFFKLLQCLAHDLRCTALCDTADERPSRGDLARRALRTCLWL